MRSLGIAGLLEDAYGDIPLSFTMIDRFLGWAPGYAKELEKTLARGEFNEARQRIKWLREAARFIHAGRIVTALDAALQWQNSLLRAEAQTLNSRLSVEIKRVRAFRENFASP